MLAAICDDEAYQRTKLAGYLEPFRSENPNLQIVEFSCGEDLLAAIHGGQVFDFVFLDIRMKEIDGIQTAQEIRRGNQSAILFFITSFTQYVSAAFTVNAFQFLVKPIRQDVFDREFRRAIQKHLLNHQKYVIQNKSRTVALEIPDITYLECSAHHIIVHTTGNEYVKSGKLNIEEQQLIPYGFVRSHQAFLVNMTHILEILPEDILLKNGAKAMVSARKRAFVLQSYNKFLAGCAL